MAQEFNFGEDAPKPAAQTDPFIDQQTQSLLKNYIKDAQTEFNRVQAITLKSGDTTFIIRNSDNMSITASVAVSLTTITNGYNGQLLTLTFNDANVTLVHDASGAKNTLNLFSGANYTSAANDTVTLFNNGTSWILKTINGVLVATKGSFGGNGADGTLSISAGTTTVNLGGANVYILNYKSVSITGTADLAFSNPAASGTKVIIKSQGAVTITSTTVPAINGTSLGGAAGAAPAVNANGNDGTNVNTDLVLDTTNHQGLLGSKDVGNAGGIGGVIYSNLAFYPSAVNRLIRKFIEAPPGSGGGSGASASTGAAIGGAGGRGGGSLIIECGGAYSVSSTLSVAGSNGTAGDNGALNFGGAGGGGGGASGNIIIMYNTLTSDTGTYTITGGNGGNGGNTGGGAPGGNGGGAGSGAGGHNGAGGDGGRGGDGTGNQANGSAAAGSSGGTGGTKGTGIIGGGGGGGGAGGFAIRALNNFFA